jgi:hypothetical protein
MDERVGVKEGNTNDPVRLCLRCHGEMRLEYAEPHPLYRDLLKCRFACECGATTDTLLGRPSGS